MHTIIKIRPETREKYDRVKRVKRLKFVEVADLAIDALLRTDPDMRKDKGRRRDPVPA